MNGHQFTLGLFGLSRVERMTVTSVCSLTQSRPRGYSVLPVERSENADIALVDADDAGARAAWLSAQCGKLSRPALMIARDATALGHAPYTLQRANFASRLVKLLDQITLREFRCMPDMMVSDDANASPLLQAPPSRAPLTPNRTRPRVLVVDDALVVRTQMAALLEIHGVEAILAADAEQAVTMMKMAGPFAMVFLDVVMPGMDGYTACRRLKNIDRDVPVFMLTGKDSAFDKIRGVMAGCNRYLTKPIAVDALSKVLQELLEKDCPAPQLVGIHS